MTTPSEPTTPGWTAPAQPAVGGAPQPDPDGTGGDPGTAAGGRPVPPPYGGAPTSPGITPVGAGGGWGPGYTSPVTAPPAPGGPSGPSGSVPGYPGPDPSGGMPRPPAYGFAPPAPRPGIIPLRPLGLGEILDGAFRAIRANPRVMFGLSAVVVAVAVTIQAVLQWYVGGLVAGQIGEVSASLDPTGELGFAETLGPALASVVTAPLIAIATTVLTGLLIVSVSRSVIGQRIPVGEVWSQSWRRVLLLLVFSFVTTVLVLVAWGAWVGLLVVLGESEQWGLLAAVGLLGGLGLLVATVWFLVRILLIPPALVLEGTSVGTALRRGWRLTRGSFWRLLGIYLLTSIMVAIVAQIIITPAALISAFVLQDPLLTSFGGLALSSIANAIAYTLTTSFMAAVIALLYIDVRMRREGLDVELTRAAGETV
ncbi:DUF7544 domain-containing protein [Cellulomonas aerilata]|uniref:Membrane protein n=1 Tax=Cellulomonas aerilata TaxID=515326 RepID=A0A512DDV8_9CELL|nr:glycerophosphoryl diester phosphodiesterase membrane domain-containing protein [Cellulomonas aerilata]GEO34420.1 membrane protein [Cellulomonas aerilata]